MKSRVSGCHDNRKRFSIDPAHQQQLPAVDFFFRKLIREKLLFRDPHVSPFVYVNSCTMLGQSSPSSPLSPPTWSLATHHQSFHFRSRHEPVDWRRLSTLDVDRVARDVDVGILQDFITSVTFCNVEAERCPNCRGPADPALIKLLQMSQLSTEYLLHCQDVLSTQLSGLEERLQGAQSLIQQTEAQRADLEKRLQESKQENRQKKKMIATQQLLLQANANNYHKCQFCEKAFINYSYLQAHVQRRHPEVTSAGNVEFCPQCSEKQKKRKVEEMEDGIEQLKEKLRLTQMQLQAEKEADSLKRQQEKEDQQRREQIEKEALVRWKEEETRKFQGEIAELRQMLLQESKDIASKSSSIEAKLLMLQNKDMNSFNTVSFQQESDPERESREKELKERMYRKVCMHSLKVNGKRNWRKHSLGTSKRKRRQDFSDQKILQIENSRLLKALSVEKNSSSSLQKLQQQIVSLSTQLSQKDKHIKTQQEKIKKLSAIPIPVPVALHHSPVEPEEEESESLQESDEPQLKTPQFPKPKPVLMRKSKHSLEERLDQKLESMGLRKGTKGISMQTFKSLNSLLSGQRLQRYKQQPDHQNLRDSLTQEVIRRVNGLQTSRGKLTPRTLKKRVKKTSTPLMEKRFRSREDSKASTQREKNQQLQSLIPKPTPRSKVPPQNQTLKIVPKKSSTPPFSSDEESVEDINGSRCQPSPSVHLVQSGSLLNPDAVPDWTDSELSQVSDAQKHGSVVQTLTRSLERQLSTPIKKPVGGTRVLPPSTPSPRPAIVKQRALSDEESDWDVSSIEELTGRRTGVGVHKSSEVGGNSGTSAWSSAASRAGAW
ncbi:hypothetical protein DNTS_029733 [Danionella cerebrum]|uniref:C2H2-type domain-containing protein n=1 Tax=Danionella cerebrum TaxID=2873325 RepID=A0A553P517_9TELE|nr:hypothetical protein DNTS_029733 [Danionella translucida]